VKDSELSPVYVLDNEVKTVDFTQQIENETGKLLMGVDDSYMRVLNMIYRYNRYNQQSIEPNVITPELYFHLYGKQDVPIIYKSLGREVRKICGDLLKGGFLSKRDDKSYEIKK